MKKFTLLFTTLLMTTLLMCAISAFSQYVPTPVSNPRWFKDYIIFSDTIRIGDTTTTHMRILPNGKIYMIDNFSFDNSVDSFLVRDNITGEIKLRTGISSGSITGIPEFEIAFGANDESLTSTPHFMFGDEFGGDILYINGTNPMIDMRDPANDFAANYSNYGVFFTDGSGAAMDIQFDRIRFVDNDDGQLVFLKQDDNSGSNYSLTFPAQLGSGNEFFFVDASGNIDFVPITGSLISGLTNQQIQYANSSGIQTGNSLFLFDDSDYTFSIGSTNTENYNFSITDLTGRAENMTTGFNAETLMKLRYANGTAASPTAIQSGDAIGVYGFAGHDGTAYTGDVDGGMKMIATENWATGAHGNYLLFALKATGSNTLSKKMRLDENGLNIGAFGTHVYMLDVKGDVNIASGSNYKINGTNISTSNVVEGSGLYYTNERVDDEVDALIVAGTNITKSYNDAGNALTINASYKTSIMGQPATTVGASTTTYAPIMGQATFNATEANRQIIMPFDGTASNLYVRITGAQSATGSMVVTVRKNGVATSLTCTIAAGSGTGTFSDTSNSFSFVAGDRITVQFVNNATATSTSIPCFSFMIQ